jgi:hypothetical protein
MPVRHVIARQINRQRIYRDDPVKKKFLVRVRALLKDSGTKCYAREKLDSVVRGKILAKKHDYFWA